MVPLSRAIDGIALRCLYSSHIHPDARLRDPDEATTDGFVSRGMLGAITALPPKAQTSLLRFLLQLGSLDEITGDHLISAILAFGTSQGIRKLSHNALKGAAEMVGTFSPDDIDIDLLRCIAEVASDYHSPLLRLLLVSRPMGNMNGTLFFLHVWDAVNRHRTRTMWVDDVNRIAHTVALGPDFDDIVLRFLDNQRNDRGETMEREVQARLEARTITQPMKPNSQGPVE